MPRKMFEAIGAAILMVASMSCPAAAGFDGHTAEGSFRKVE